MARLCLSGPEGVVGRCVQTRGRGWRTGFRGAACHPPPGGIPHTPPVPIPGGRCAHVQGGPKKNGLVHMHVERFAVVHLAGRDVQLNEVMLQALATKAQESCVAVATGGHPVFRAISMAFSRSASA